MKLRAFWLSLLVVGAAVAVSLRPWESVPDAWNPWVPLRVDHSMNPVTRWKLERLERSRDQCLAVLEAAPADAVEYVALADYTPVEDCPLTNVVRIHRTSVEFNAAFTVTCPLAVAWLMFEGQALQPLASELLGAQVARIDHFGSFACRNVYHRANGRRSEHASAAAFDVAAIRLRDGRRLTVLDQWEDDDQPENAHYLKEVHDAACGYFGTVLGPDYNAPHENHFHFGTRGYRLCR